MIYFNYNNSTFIGIATEIVLNLSPEVPDNNSTFIGFNKKHTYFICKCVFIIHIIGTNL